MESTRLDYIDIVKGICIILVVFFHFPYISTLPNFSTWGGYVTTFYMPLFFVMSGLFFKPQNIMYKVKRLMIPYISFYVAAYAMYVLKCIVIHEEIDWLNFFFPFCGKTINYQNTPIWFLLVLAEIDVISSHICSFLCGCLGYLLGKVVNMPYYIDVALVNLLFFLLAYYYRCYILNINWIYGIILIIVSVITYLANPGITNVSQNYIPMGYLLFIVVSVTASLGFVGVTKLITGIGGKVIAFVGKNSLIIMCTHMMLMAIPSFLVGYMQNLYYALFLGLLIILLIEIPIILLINRYFNFMLGK